MASSESESQCSSNGESKDEEQLEEYNNSNRSICHLISKKYKSKNIIKSS